MHYSVKLKYNSKFPIASRAIQACVFVFLFFLLHGCATAQKFTSPKKFNAGVTTAIEINDDKDLEFIKKNLNQFYGVQIVRVNGEVNVEKTAAILELLDDLEDVQLLKFTGEFNDKVVEKLEWVNTVSIYLKNGKEDAILMTPSLKNISNLTLIFETTPTDYYFLETWNKVKSLTLVAPFVAVEAKQAITAAAQLKQLQHFGISLDKMSDLHAEIKKLANLKKITIIDNYSWLATKYIDDLPIAKRNIEVEISPERTKQIEIVYKSLDVEFTIYDNQHLLQLFGAGKYVPLANEQGDTSSSASFANFVPLTPFTSYTEPKLQSSVNFIFPELKEGWFQFDVDSEKDQIFYLGTDFTVLVPKNAFQYQHGLGSVVGKFRMQVKALNKPTQFVQSSVSLNLDSSGKQYVLAPSAVLEISAWQDKQILQVKPGFFLLCKYLANMDTTLRFYAYNENEKKWENFYDYDYRFDDTKIVPIDFYSFYSNKQIAQDNWVSDRTNLDARFETYQYYYLLEPGESKIDLLPFGKQYIQREKQVQPNSGAYRLRRGARLVGLKKEFVNKKEEFGIVKFQVFDKTATLFPELSAFNNYIFELETEMSPKDFSKQFIIGAVYSDVRFTKLGGDYFLDLKTETGYWHFKLLQPEDRNFGAKKKNNSDQIEFVKKMNRYFSLRQDKINKWTTYNYNFSNSSIQNSKRVLFYGSVKPKNQRPRDIKVRSTGVFAIAKPAEIADTFRLMLIPTNEGGIALNTKKIIVAHARPYRYATYSEKKENIVSVFVEPKNLLYILLIDQQNNVYYLNKEMYNLQQLKSNTLIYLPMKLYPRPVKNITDIEKELKLNKQ